MPDRESLVTKLEQGRAEFAYRCVEELVKIQGDVQERFKKYVENKLKEEIEKGTIEETQIDRILTMIIEFCKEKNLPDIQDKICKMYRNLLKDYRSYSRKIPQMVLSNGLGQTLAFVKSKARDGNAYDVLYSQIADYLKSNSTSRIKMPDNAELVEWVISLDSYNYHYATEEILAFLNWLRRFAEGLIETTEGEGEV